jgi:Kef-type K+ transport system membrane component KefB
MPRGRFAEELHRQLHPLVTSFLLPVFFVYSGLNTKIGLVDTPWLWALAGVVLLAATLGKGVACYAAARWQGEPHHESMAIGTLMNARGLMELIILNIGLQRGLIEPALFAIMVIMAIVTTVAATPVFNGIQRARERAAAAVRAASTANAP